MGKAGLQDPLQDWDVGVEKCESMNFCSKLYEYDQFPRQEAEEMVLGRG